FPRLPAELRLRIWYLSLKRQRMIKVAVWTEWTEDWAKSSDQSKSRYFMARNHLGKLVSGGSYSTQILHPNRPALFSPLLWVTCESRQAALGFYRVHLPTSIQGRSSCGNKTEELVLYFNPEHDIVDIEDWSLSGAGLVDFLHDARAYDRKGRGVTHLALDMYGTCPGHSRLPSPTTIHPVAAVSFAEILQYTLRTVLQPVPCNGPFRIQPTVDGDKSHFAQTMPLHANQRWDRFGTGNIRWLETDPRWGVEHDLGAVSFRRNPLTCLWSWEDMERAFGIAERVPDDKFRFYLCPYIHWPAPQSYYDAVHDKSTVLPPRQNNPFLKSPWREKLAAYLHVEQEHWLRRTRQEEIPRHGSLVDAETFQRMESVPSTALGMWLCSPEAFGNSDNPAGKVFDLSASRPGLL
ncbi:uncharacterized protein B0T15DRAFT_375087, partial [Chaetomium strumarium]